MDSIRDLLRPAVETSGELSLLEADLTKPRDAEAVVRLLDDFARDPLGVGRPLPEEVNRNLIPGLLAQPDAFVLLAILAGEAVGILVAFSSYSTFHAKPVLNIHDFSVRRAYRGRRIGRAMLRVAEARARRMGCARLTLEVREDNDRALRLYDSEGYEGQRSRDGRPRTLFLEKPLDRPRKP